MSSSARTSNPPPERRKTVAVVGSASPNAEVLVMAAQVGAIIRRLGLNMVCGGLAGVMAAACRGFQEAKAGQPPGPVAVGILPGDDPAAANPWVDAAVATGMGFARNAVVVRSADAVVAVGGGAGTLSEVAFAWQTNRPIVALVPSGGWSQILAGDRIDDRRPDAVIAAQTIEQVEAALRQVLGLGAASG
ncbi:MAG: TIGR00725 family protein [Deltaproteobacteria bacterium]|nr:TIGR00725 family protein [Deltaproteobacteria bacterium]